MAQVALGTAQLGLSYGINNSSGQPSLEQAFDLLDLALEWGVRAFDTAPAYGTAEKVLGSYIRQRNLKGKVDVTTKLRANFRKGASSSTTELVVKEVEQSLERLGVDGIEGYLLHDFNHMYDSEVMEALSTVKERGLVKRLGVSIYEEKDALFAVNSDLIDQIQIPYSILDQRLDQGSFFPLAQERNKLVHARSSFLQGLVFMEPQQIPAHLSDARPYIERLNQLARQFDRTVFELALLFSRSHPGISHVLFGAENCGQLTENLEVFSGPGLDGELLKALRKDFQKVPSYVLDPRRWSE